jgi:hypothetical protein
MCMFFGQKPHRSIRAANHPVFKEIWDSCAKELKEKGFDTEVYFVPGGVGVKILNDDYPSIAKIAHLPISEFDFSQVSNPILAHLDFFRLQGLKLSRSPEVNFSELSPFSLRRIHADSSTARDFSALSAQPLEELSLCQTNLSNLDFLKDIKLHAFFTSNNPIDSIGGLDCQELKILDLFKCPMLDLAPLVDSPIEELNLNGTMISDLSPLAARPLRKLEMRATQVRELSSLSDCPLEVLHLPGSPIKNISPLSYLPLKEINLIGLSIEDLDPLSTMPLEHLSLSPDKLSEGQFELLRGIKLKSLIGPGDPPGQTPSDFFKKYENDKRRN